LNFAVDVRGVRKTFTSGVFRKRKKEALKGVDLSVPEGAFWGILGPNGAGKTTLLSILSNLLIPEKGEVRIFGKDIRTQGTFIGSRMNLSSGHANFFWSMTVRQNLDYYARLYGLSKKKRADKIAELLGLFGLEDFAGVKFDQLSTGTKQKLSLSKALLNEPDLLLLDEPSVGLDPDVARRIREFILHLHREKKTTILLTTHNMKEAEILCEQVAFIREGTIRACGKPADLKRELRLGDMILIEFHGELETSALDRITGVYGFDATDSACRIRVDDHHQRLPQILDFFSRQRIFIHDLRIEESDLEDVFLAFAK
jgi:ABC-2 type transport system ATP-binding protein